LLHAITKMALGGGGLEENYWERWTVRQRLALEALPGGRELMALFGGVPSFHDAEIIRLDLRRLAPSTIELYYPMTLGGVGPFIVEINIGTVVDLQLDGFSRQNVVGDIAFVYPAPVRPNRERTYSPTNRESDEVEIVIAPCYGLDGYIRCLDVSLSMCPCDEIS
jgi:hypothetical protein